MVTSPFDRSFYLDEIKQFQNQYPVYLQFCNDLQKILEFFAAEITPGCIVQGRVKSAANLIDKLSRNKGNTHVLLSEISDICALRVISPNVEALRKIAESVKRQLTILTTDTEESGNYRKFYGIEYAPIIYIVQIPASLELLHKLHIDYPPDMRSLKAEIQLCTALQHSWILNYFDPFHKNDLTIPLPYYRGLSRIAALLETTDKCLSDQHENMQKYELSFSSYMSKEEIKAEIERLEFILEIDKTDLQVAQKLAKLEMVAEDWKKAKKILEAILENTKDQMVSQIKHAAILRDLGIVVCKLNKPETAEFQRGQLQLEQSIKLNPRDSDALAALGGTYKSSHEEEKAQIWYKRALDENPGDPYALGNFLIYEIKKSRNLNCIEHYDGMLKTAISRRLHQIEVLVDLPWAFFDVGLFSLLLGDFDTSFTNYLHGIRYSLQSWMIETTLETLNSLKLADNQINSIQLIRILLLLGLAFHPSNDLKSRALDKILPQLEKYLEKNEKFASQKIVILAGGTSVQFEDNLELFRDALTGGFRDYKGLIISGGTKRGIGKLVGDITANSSTNVSSIGYVPRNKASDIPLDERYTEIRQTSGKEFSILEGLQYWFDLLKSNIAPKNVKLIGVNGGNISALEYGMAIAFGAQVGILDQSGRAASNFIHDPLWQDTDSNLRRETPKKKFKLLENTPSSIHDFLTRPFITDPDVDNLQRIIIRESAGRDLFHANFVESDIDGSLIAAITTALDMMGVDLNIGQILATKFKNGYIMAGFFNGTEFKVMFLLRGPPSKTLEEKFSRLLVEFEKNYISDFLVSQQNCLTYLYSPKLETTFVDIFGPEILKLFHSVQ